MVWIKMTAAFIILYVREYKINKNNSEYVIIYNLFQEDSSFKFFFTYLLKHLKY